MKKKLIIAAAVTAVTVITFKSVQFVIKNKKASNKNGASVDESQGAPKTSSATPSEESPTEVVSEETTSAAGMPRTNSAVPQAPFSPKEIEAYNKKRASVNGQIEGLRKELKNLPRKPQNRQQALAIKNKIALLESKYRLL